MLLATTAIKKYSMRILKKLKYVRRWNLTSLHFSTGVIALGYSITSLRYSNMTTFAVTKRVHI